VTDGHIIIAVGNDGQFKAFCELLAVPELAEDERFKTNAGRLVNREAMLDVIIPLIKEYSSADLMEKLRKKGIPTGPINNIAQMFESPQIKARGVWQEISHPLAGKTPTTASPMRFSDTPVQYRMAPPLLGEHTEEVLAEFGLALDDIKET